MWDADRRRRGPGGPTAAARRPARRPDAARAAARRGRRSRATRSAATASPRTRWTCSPASASTSTHWSPARGRSPGCGCARPAASTAARAFDAAGPRRAARGLRRPAGARPRSGRRELAAPPRAHASSPSADGVVVDGDAARPRRDRRRRRRVGRAPADRRAAPRRRARSPSRVRGYAPAGAWRRRRAAADHDPARTGPPTRGCSRSATAGSTSVTANCCAGPPSRPARICSSTAARACCPAGRGPARCAVTGCRCPPAARPWRTGRVLLAGDAASLINPLTGEGIYYAVLSGALAGGAALADDPAAAYRARCAARWARTCARPTCSPGSVAGRPCSTAVTSPPARTSASSTVRRDRPRRGTVDVRTALALARPGRSRRRSEQNGGQDSG